MMSHIAYRFYGLGVLSWITTQVCITERKHVTSMNPSFPDDASNYTIYSYRYSSAT